ncbi:MAG: ABC transporter permease subunit/CPBP intramembrane protease [Planctomycetota bacterium]
MNPDNEMSMTASDKRRAAKAADRPRVAAIGLIYLREMRDQLRDRRTIFTIVVLPMLLYPVVGMLLLQVAQFTRVQPTTVCFVGTEFLGDKSVTDGVGPLIEASERESSESGQNTSPYRFAQGLEVDQSVLSIHGYEWAELERSGDPREQAQRWVSNGVFDCVVTIDGVIGGGPSAEADTGSKIDLFFHVASDPSLVARDRTMVVLNRWRGTWVRTRLATAGVDMQVLDPFAIDTIDVAPEETRQAAFWSKLLPFIMLVWAMTGAFYPAIDLVAGEKERGTLETLLCSPALREEIVWGKLGAVMTFSMLTALLNAISMVVTSSSVFRQIAIAPGANPMSDAFSGPPLLPMLWLLVALVPLSALFSALALAVAAMARSSKEGQYYLMPLMMVTLPLVLLPMLPGMTLNLGTGLIPVTGMFLLVRTLVEGQYWEACLYAPAVAFVTLLCLMAATRWARRQFESEAVLFGDGDQWELGAWMRHLWRDREQAATPNAAYGCGAIILVALFFAKLMVTEMPSNFRGIANLVLAPQIGLILAPTLLMATVMTTSLRSSLRLRWPSWRVWPVVAVLSLALHPFYLLLASWISQLYPVSAEATASMKPFAEAISSAPLASVIFLMALVPALCEELAFRGFIFGGLVRNNSPWRAVLVTAVMFGVSHGVLQQSISASFMGVLLGWIALRTGSVLPGIWIHLVNNALSVSFERVASLDSPLLDRIVTTTAAGPSYAPLWTAICFAVSGLCVLLLIRVSGGACEVTPADSGFDRIVDAPGATDPALAT